MIPTFSKPSMGILNLRKDEPKFHLTRHTPSVELSHFIRHYWIIKSQDVIPNPCANMVFKQDMSAIYGVSSNKSTRFVQGKGQVLGV